MWLDAADLSSIVSSAGKVSAWKDKSDSNVYFIQSSSNHQPVTSHRLQNDLNVIDFNGAHWMMTSSIYDLGSDFTIFIFAGIDTIDSNTDSLFSSRLANSDYENTFQIAAASTSDFRTNVGGDSNMMVGKTFSAIGTQSSMWTFNFNLTAVCLQIYANFKLI